MRNEDKEHCNIVILDGSTLEEKMKNMIAKSLGE